MNDKKQRNIVLFLLVAVMIVFFLYRKNPKVSNIIYDVSEALGIPNVAPAIINLGEPNSYGASEYQPANMGDVNISLPDDCCPTCSKNNIMYAGLPEPIIPVTNTMEIVKYIYPSPPPQPKTGYKDVLGHYYNP